MTSKGIADRLLRKYTHQEAKYTVRTWLGGNRYLLESLLKTGGIEAHGTAVVAKRMARVMFWQAVLHHIQEA